MPSWGKVCPGVENAMESRPAPSNAMQSPPAWPWEMDSEPVSSPHWSIGREGWRLEKMDRKLD